MQRPYNSSSYRGAEVAGGRPRPEHPLLRFPEVRAKLITTPQGAQGLEAEAWVAEAERDERGMAVAGTQAGRGGGLGVLRGTPAPLIPGQAPPRSPCPSHPPAPPLACCSLGGDDAGS